MKRFVFILIAASIALLSCNGWKQVPDKMELLVNRIEQDCGGYTPDDWERVREEYSDLMKTYRKDKEKYTAEEKSRIAKAVGRYRGLMIKQGLNDAATMINGIPDYLDGITRVIDDPEDNPIDAIEDGVDNLIDYVEDEVVGLLEKLEKFFE